jgi:hypothetical protein
MKLRSREIGGVVLGQPFREVTLYDAQRVRVGTFAGTLVVWVTERVGSFATGLRGDAG